MGSCASTSGVNEDVEENARVLQTLHMSPTSERKSPTLSSNGQKKADPPLATGRDDDTYSNSVTSEGSVTFDNPAAYFYTTAPSFDLSASSTQLDEYFSIFALQFDKQRYHDLVEKAPKAARNFCQMRSIMVGGTCVSLWAAYCFQHIVSDPANKRLQEIDDTFFSAAKSLAEEQNEQQGTEGAAASPSTGLLSGDAFNYLMQSLRISDDAVFMFLLHELGATLETPWNVSLKCWRAGWISQQAYSLDAMTRRAEQLAVEYHALQLDQPRFRKFACFVFRFACRSGNVKRPVMGVEEATAVVTSLLGSRWEPYALFCSFLSSKKVPALTCDQFDQLVEFSAVVPTRSSLEAAASTCSASSSSWPVLLDDFVQWAADSKGGKGELQSS